MGLGGRVGPGHQINSVEFNTITRSKPCLMTQGSCGRGGGQHETQHYGTTDSWIGYQTTGGNKDALTRPQTTDCTVVVLVTVNRFPKKPVCARAICFVFLFFPQNHWHETRVQELRTQSQRATQEQ